MPSIQLATSMYAALTLSTGEDIQKWKTNYADITQGKQKNPYDRSVFDLTIVTNSYQTRREIHDGSCGLIAQCTKNSLRAEP